VSQSDTKAPNIDLLTLIAVPAQRQIKMICAPSLMSMKSIAVRTSLT
jgi:hypothetical protein